ncbi:MAG: hypothetical protein HRU19_06470 [Pseudobacteriovorax sp.]|nr:hypothetical protein [Pseudobacteriovorax sp.]
MVDLNVFKKNVKDWIREHPEGTLQDLRDFCEDSIPAAQYTSYEWLVDQTVGWYKHILTHREISDEQLQVVD